MWLGNASVFEHCPMVVKWFVQLKNFRRIFKFYKMWMQHPMFSSSVASTCNGLMIGDHKDCCIRKLWKVKEALKALNREHFADILRQVESYKVLLKQCQTALRHSLLNQDLVAEERRLRLDLQKLLKAEESFYRFQGYQLQKGGQNPWMETHMGGTSERMVKEEPVEELLFKFVEDSFQHMDSTSKVWEFTSEGENAFLYSDGSENTKMSGDLVLEVKDGISGKQVKSKPREKLLGLRCLRKTQSLDLPIGGVDQDYFDCGPMQRESKKNNFQLSDMGN
ncbi:hypothetical protein Ancab_012240 [Ancistrocladus abbreviatus]